MITICYLAVFPPRVMPNIDRLISGSKVNPHGFGWSVGVDEVYHSLAGETAILSFMEARDHRPDEPAMFHARYATGDSPHTLVNCQPLVLDDGTLLAHNGGLYPVEGDLSDTWDFAKNFLPRWNLDDAAERLRLNEIIAPNKLFILRPGKLPVLLGDRYGVWYPDGSWASNRDGEDGNHLAAGQCGACGKADPDLAAVSRCATCETAYHFRHQLLEAAR